MGEFTIVDHGVFSEMGAVSHYLIIEYDIVVWLAHLDFVKT